jgi:uncharacterized membrane protein YjgN (DUF898 family)
MEKTQTYALSYKGSGSELFKIQIVNLILTTVTLGLYYPWAKARSLEYLYGQSHFEESPFAFTGTGKEMFKGFIKAFILIVVVYGVSLALVYMRSPVLATLWLYGCLFAILPLAIHGSYKYRMAKTNWRGIRFGYTGDRTELIKLCVKGILLTIVTLGIYGAWFAINLRRYIISHIKMGNASFNYHGDGGDYFWMNLKGYFLTLFTLGIYSFWWQKSLFEYFVNHTELEQGNEKVYLQSKATAGGFFELTIVNVLLLIFTLGLAFPWVITRNLRFVTNNIEFNGDISFEALQQEQADYSNATGEDLSDFFDFGFVI